MPGKGGQKRRPASLASQQRVGCTANLSLKVMKFFSALLPRGLECWPLGQENCDKFGAIPLPLFFLSHFDSVFSFFQFYNTPAPSMCKSTEQYKKYDSCTLKAGGTIADHIRLRKDRQHHIKMKVIHLCRVAKERADQSPCSVIEDLVPDGVLEEPAFSSYAGPCPACDAANDASNQTIIVCIKTRTIRS